MKKSIKDFESLIDDHGIGAFTAQTANGTAHAVGTGWNETLPKTAPQLPPMPTRPAGRSNRTAE